MTYEYFGGPLDRRKQEGDYEPADIITIKERKLVQYNLVEIWENKSGDKFAFYMVEDRYNKRPQYTSDE